MSATSDAALLQDEEILATGLMLYLEDPLKSKKRNGKVFFSLSELEINTTYWTERKTTVIRTNAKQVKVGNKTVSINPTPKWNVSNKNEEDVITNTNSPKINQSNGTTTTTSTSTKAASRRSIYTYSPDPNGRSKSVIGLTKSSKEPAVQRSTSVEEAIQEKAAEKVASLATNEKTQQWAGEKIGNAAKDAKVQSAIGEQFAKNTDNKFLASLAKNKSIQNSVGSMFSVAAKNKVVQQQVGGAIAQQAKNKDNQKSATKFLKSMLV